MPSERCEFCGQFGARRNVFDRGPNGHGGRDLRTFYECARCEAKQPRDAKGDLLPCKPRPLGT